MFAAAYCRVSTDQSDQANSFASQQRYFRDYIDRRPDLLLYDIYADEGITGTSTKKRTEFNRMMQDAREGRFQVILTKEVSRFSRNILDTIRYTRELKELGVGVLFLLDGIDSMRPDAELYLAIMASLAQEESRKTSARVVWGQTRQMEKGVVFGPSLLGYDVKNGEISIKPQGAETVRLIFHKYALAGCSTVEIAADLTMRGIPTHRGSTQWRPGTIVKILKNEKYVGDLVQKKTYTPDYLTHEKRRNSGQVPLVIIRDHHTPIVSRELWEQAQQRLSRNNRRKSGSSQKHPLSGKIICASCGSFFVSRVKRRGDGTVVRSWRCSAAVRGGKAACGAPTIRENTIMALLTERQESASAVAQITVFAGRHGIVSLAGREEEIPFSF